MGRLLIDMTGLTFGDFKALKKVTALGRDTTYWLCQCTSCGRTVVKKSYYLRKTIYPKCTCHVEKSASRAAATHTPRDFKTKYGCNYCADKRECRQKALKSGEIVCQYADIIDACGCFDNYLEENPIPEGIIINIGGY